MLDEVFISSDLQGLGDWGSQGDTDRYSAGHFTFLAEINCNFLYPLVEQLKHWPLSSLVVTQSNKLTDPV